MTTIAPAPIEATEAEMTARRPRHVIDWSALPLGIESDLQIARRTGIDERSIGRARRRLGIQTASRAERGCVVDMRTPYRADVSCQLFVDAFPVGMTLDAIGDAMGVTRERIRQIEGQALQHFGARLALAGVTREDFEALLARRQGE